MRRLSPLGVSLVFTGGLRVGVLTNGPSELQRHKLAVTGLDGLLDAVAISAFGGLVLR